MLPSKITFAEAKERCVKAFDERRFQAQLKLPEGAYWRRSHVLIGGYYSDTLDNSNDRNTAYSYVPQGKILVNVYGAIFQQEHLDYMKEVNQSRGLLPLASWAIENYWTSFFRTGDDYDSISNASHAHDNWALASRYMEHGTEAVTLTSRRNLFKRLMGINR